jgi:hypothetical protein
MLRGQTLNLEDQVVFNHHPNIPSSFYALIIDRSGMGKTFSLLQMLFKPNLLDYNHIIIFCLTIKLHKEY